MLNLYIECKYNYSENRILNSIAYEVRDLVYWLVALHIQQLALEGLLDVADLLVPDGEPLPDHSLLVLEQLNQPACCGLILGREHLQVVVDARGWVDPPVRDPPDALLLRLLEHADEGGPDLERLQEVDLGVRLREAVHDPPVHSAVRLLQSLLHQRYHYRVRHKHSRVYAFGDGLTHFRIP